ncbi:MAG TPA: hypothetical protein VFA29_02580 [Candidatus Baltobacteraceae bacterium]|nr:hypothetical protein [Candidatus Baltobacteraceae bacterium]
MNRICAANEVAGMWLHRAFAMAALVGAAALGPPPSETYPQDAFLLIPTAFGAQVTAREINARKHYPGTPGDYALAVYMRDKMRQFGLQAELEPFDAIVYAPQLLQLQLLTDPVRTFDLREQPVPGDPDGTRPDAGVPFNAGSGDGDVSASAVYVGRGLEADYAVLANAGVTTQGRIALIRYGA